MDLDPVSSSAPRFLCMCSLLDQPLDFPWLTAVLAKSVYQLLKATSNLHLNTYRFSPLFDRGKIL